MLLETKGKAILIIKQQRMWLGCAPVLSGGSTGDRSEKFLAEMVSKQAVERYTCFLLLLIEICEEGGK